HDGIVAAGRGVAYDQSDLGVIVTHVVGVDTPILVADAAQALDLEVTPAPSCQPPDMEIWSPRGAAIPHSQERQVSFGELVPESFLGLANRGVSELRAGAVVGVVPEVVHLSHLANHPSVCPLIASERASRRASPPE